MSESQPVATGQLGATETSYWRSLEQLGSGPSDYDRWLAQEFADGADLPPDSVSRRNFFGVVAASVALAGLTSCRKPVQTILPFAKRPEGFVPGKGLHYATAHDVGGYAVGTLVTSTDGRPTYIAGNPDHPMSLGGATPQMIGDLLNLYDPARSQRVTKGSDPTILAAFHDVWREKAAEFRQTRGKGLHLLMPATTSPSVHSMLKVVRESLPAATVHTWSPTNRDADVAGSKLAFGTALDAHFDIARANVIACFDRDLLNDGPAALAYARAWGERRKAPATTTELPRLYAVEPTFTPTGAMADHRFRLRASDVATALFALGAALLDQGATSTAVGDDLARAMRAHKDHGFRHGGKNWIDVLAKDLWASRGRAFVCVGSDQPAVAHATAHAINSLLGSVGTVVSFTATPEELAVDQQASIRALAAALDSGAVDTLFCLGSNPVYAAPADLGFAAKLAKAKLTVHLGQHRDETAQACAWHIPQSHDLEAWGDLRAYDGNASIVQPLIAPLYKSVSSLELLAQLIDHKIGGKTPKGYDIVRATWQAQGVGADDFEAWWRRTLHAGLVSGSAAARVAAPALRGADLATTIGAHAKPAAGSLQSLEVSFRAHPTVGDGRHANNGWLQELPHPITKLTWDNAAMMSLATARALGVTLGDLIEVSLDGRRLEVAVWVAPGHADWSVTIELGFGRKLTPDHKVAAGAGFNAYALRGGSSFGLGATARKTGAKYELATTQDHGTIEGRALYREATLSDYKKEPTFAPDKSPLAQAAKVQGKTEADLNKSLWQERDYTAGYQWGMVIDLNSCTGCNACVIACVAENNIPVVGKPQVRKGREMHWLRLDRYFTVPEGQEDPGSVKGVDESTTIAAAEDPQMVTQPVPCMQCENAPCESVCPVAATTHTPEGLNDMVYNRCIGTRYCNNNCPYKVRRFNFFDFTSKKAETEKMAMNPQVTVRSRGVMEKCTYCVQRIEGARSDAKSQNRLIRDGDIETACSQACPTQTITFGDINDKDSRVSRLRASSLHYAMLSELNTKPRTTYLARIRNPHPELV